jgi:hypothetical protein
MAQLQPDNSEGAGIRETALQQMNPLRSDLRAEFVDRPGGSGAYASRGGPASGRYYG